MLQRHNICPTYKPYRLDRKTKPLDWLKRADKRRQFRSSQVLGSLINGRRLSRGHKISLSLPRRFICDLLHFAKKVPSVPMQRRMRLGNLISARAACSQRISWSAIFMKAYAIVSAEHPELRRTYMSVLWGHLYEHPKNVCAFSLEREYEGENGVFFAKIHEPEKHSLRELDTIVKYHKNSEISSIPSYRHTLLLSRLPKPIRRFLWWLGLETDGCHKAYCFGTYAVSVVASIGAASLHILSPLTTTLNYGVFEPDGSIDVRLTYDHRVLDGATVARAIVALEEVLHTQILQELCDESHIRAIAPPQLAIAS